MQQIADWLEKLHLGQYAQRFAENDIDVSVLRHLTDTDLEKIGVSLGHRRKILAAIAELPGASPSKHQPADGAGAETPRNCGAPPSHRYVFRPSRLNRPIGTDGPRRPPRGQSRPIRRASRRLWVASAASWRSSWATVC